jgi:phosphorylcholine metabolism protein LicD
MNPGNAKNLIEPIVDVLQLHNIPFFPVEGSLIGYMRNGGFNAFDHDIDLGMLAEDWDDSILTDLENNGLEVMKLRKWKEPWMLNHVGEDKRGQMAIIRFKAKGQEGGDPHIDFHIFHKNGDFRYYPWFQNKMCKVPAEFFEPLTPITYDGYPMHCLANPDAYLRWYYGDWTIPVPREEYLASDVRKEAQKRYMIYP